MRLDEIDLQATLRCNLRCGFCSVRANGYEPAELPLDRILALIDEAAPLGMQQLHLTGGEPTLRDDLEEIVAHASSLGVKTRLITNGSLLDRGRLERLARAGLGNIMVSVDAMSGLHDALRGQPGTWDRAMATVRASIELGLGTRISAVAFRDNLEEIEPLMREAARLEVPIFSIFLGSPLGRGAAWQDRVVPPDRWRRFLATLEEGVARGLYGARMEIIAEQGFCWPDTRGYDRSSLEGRGAGCTSLLDAFDYLLVRGDGEIFQCVFFMHEGPTLGNVGSRSLREILDRAVQQRLYERFTRVCEACSRCSRVEACGGGCRGYAQLCHRDWFRPDPRCRDGREPFFPVCPIAKLNMRSGRVGGSSEHALALGEVRR